MAHLLITTDIGYVLKTVIGKTKSFSFFISNKIVIVEASNHLSKPSDCSLPPKTSIMKMKKRKKRKYLNSQICCVKTITKNITIILVRYLLDMSDYLQCCVSKISCGT